LFPSVPIKHIRPKATLHFAFYHAPRDPSKRFQQAYHKLALSFAGVPKFFHLPLRFEVPVGR
jgi:hypothetical protein